MKMIGTWCAALLAGFLAVGTAAETVEIRDNSGNIVGRADLDLGIAHAVSDKQKDVFWVFPGAVDGGVREGRGKPVRLGGGSGGAGRQAQHRDPGQKACEQSFHHVHVSSLLHGWVGFTGLVRVQYRPRREGEETREWEKVS